MTKLCQPFDEIGTRSASNSEIWSVYEIEWQNLVVFPDTQDRCVQEKMFIVFLVHK